MMAALWLMGGAILSSLGILGLYIARIVEEVKERPAYIVRDRLGARRDSDFVQARAIDRQRRGRRSLDDRAVGDVVEDQRSRADDTVRADRDSVA